MKTKHLIILSFLIILCTSCTISYSPPFYQHVLRLIFQDTSGNNLLKDIDPEHWEKLHTLEEVVYTEPCMDSYPSPKPLYGSVNEPECIIQKKDGHHYMHIDIISNHSKNCSSTARMITFQLTCPYLFGDDNIHEIETYWIQENQGRVGYSKCYRIVMGDRDITSIVYEGKGVNVESVATITLDK